MDELRARAIIARTPRLSAALLRELVAAAGGDPARALDAARLRAAPLAPETSRHLSAPPPAALEADLHWLERSAARVLLASDADYPRRLLEFADAPAALYVHGAVAALGTPQLAMLGSRHPSVAGATTAREFAAWFARAGLTVTSGLSTGIDAASHLGALEGGGATVAVCGTGLDQVYPPTHAALAARIRESGALVTELPPRSPATRAQFARRNRLIAGLSAGVLVVEAARGSAPVLTARLAAEAGREVFAIPGSIHSPLSRGPHQLLRAGAKLVEEAADVLTELQNSHLPEALNRVAPPAAAAPELDNEYEMLLDALAFEPATVDVLAARTHLPGESVASMLLILELEGRVTALPGGRYGRKP